MILGTSRVDRRTALRHVGDISQLASITPIEYSDGAARGVRALAVRSAFGLDFDVLVDRGLDLGWASSSGAPLAWLSPRGFAAPAFAETDGFGWGRTFGGGLLTTCGLSSIGRPSTDGDETFGLHGRVSSIPAQQVSHRAEWRGDDYVLVIEGRVIESTLGGATLELKRVITTVAGVAAVTISDTVTNIGSIPAPYMVRHHINLGFPLVRPGDRVAVDAPPPSSRDEASLAKAGAWDLIAEPREDAPEEVFMFSPAVAHDGTATVSLVAADGAPRLTVGWTASTMPGLLVWKFPRDRMNVLALEPSTHDDLGRAHARANGTLTSLAIDDSVSFETNITVH